MLIPRLLSATAPVLLVSGVIMLAGCKPAAREPIQPAVKPTSDASAMAQEAWVLINQLDPLLYQQDATDIQQQVIVPVRELSTRWRLEVKMTDSVTEGKYALCRKSLTSLDAWARSIQDRRATIDEKRAEYERDKGLCQNAINNPQLGNSVVQ